MQSQILFILVFFLNYITPKGPYVLGVAKPDLGSFTYLQKKIDFLRLFVNMRFKISFTGVQIS
jgi:hypothetical protein